MRVAIIDGNYQLHRSMHSQSAGLFTSTGLPSGPTYIFLKMLWNFKDIGRTIVVFDSPGGGYEFRRGIYPQYKVRTPPKTEDEVLEKEETKKIFNYTFKTLLLMLPKMGIPTVIVNKQEGDDVIYRLAEYFAGQGEEVWAVSDDKDYLQFLSLPNARVYQPMKDKQYDLEVFKQEFEFDISYYTLYKSIMGDGSDNIDGVFGIGEKTTQKIMKELPEPSFKALYDWADSGSKSMHKKVKEGLPVIKRNMLLIDLKNMSLPTEEVMAVYNQAKLQAIIDFQFILEQFRKYEFHSLGNWTTHLMHQKVLETQKG